MNISRIQNWLNKGFGLVEVLITLVVVSGGFLAVASLQSSLVAASGEGKARAEALKLAEQKIEEMRNIALIAKPCDRSIQAGDYLGFESSTDPVSVTGINDIYSISWTVASFTNPERYHIGVTVSPSSSQSVQLESEISLKDLCLLSTLATGGNGGAGIAPSPNNVSSDVGGQLFNSSEFVEGEEIALNDGSGLTKYMQDDDSGNIYLLETITPDANGNDRKALIKFQGGIALSIKGTVYHGSVSNVANPIPNTPEPTDIYPIAFSDMAYCIFPLTNTEADYVCYFGGDCAYGGEGCPEETYDYQAVQGGWYGKVGLTETASANFQNKKVCFGEDITGTGIETAVTTARAYLTRRVDANNNIVGTEGINQPFVCQNFLIVDKSGSSYPCSAFADYTFPNNSRLVVAGSVMERILPVGQSNIVQAVDSTQCGATCPYIITGVISGSAREHASLSANGQVCLVTFNAETNAYNYRCAFETTAESALLAATMDIANTTITPTTQTIPLVNGIGACLDTEITGTEFVTVGIANTDCTVPWGDPLQDGQSVTVYQAAEVSPGSQCVSEQRTCSEGSLSGSFQFEDCDVLPASSCTTPWGVTVGNQSSVTAYQIDLVGPEQTCQSEVRLCENGILSGSFTYETCSNGPSECTASVNGIIIQGSGNAKEPSHEQVYVTATPGGKCMKPVAGDNYTYNCDLGTIAHGATVLISGSKVTGGSNVAVNCLDPKNDEGPTMTTTN